MKVGMEIKTSVNPAQVTIVAHETHTRVESIDSVIKTLIVARTWLTKQKKEAKNEP